MAQYSRLISSISFKLAYKLNNQITPGQSNEAKTAIIRS